jgi:hypothetical protein
MLEPGLCEFPNRFTGRWNRSYEVSVQRLWQAISTQMSDWFAVRPVFIDEFNGGRGSFGPPDAPIWSAPIEEFEPPRVISFGHPETSPEGGALRFDLVPGAGFASVVMTQTFRPGVEVAPGSHEGSDLPLGATAPWRPGFLSGFHMMFEALSIHLGLPGRAPTDERWQFLLPIYREHIVRAVPSE